MSSRSLRGQGDDEFVEPVVDILAEPARPYRQLEGDTGGGDGPHIHADRRLAAEWPHLSFLQGPQQRGLRGEGKVDDLVEEQAAASASWNRPSFRSEPKISASICVSVVAPQSMAMNACSRRALS